MADKGKRIIFTDACAPLAQPQIATEAVLPGSIVKNVAGGYAQDDTASTAFKGQLLIADYDFLAAGNVDEPHTVGDTIVARTLPKDKRANVMTATGQNITVINTGMASNGDGTLKIAGASDVVVAYADELVNTTEAQLVRVRGA